MALPGPLSSKVAVVTGAAGGLGKAIAQTFLNAGARVVLVDINQTLLDQTASELGANAHAIQADISDEPSVSKVFEEAERVYGKVGHFSISLPRQLFPLLIPPSLVDVLVNNAGIMDKFDPVGDLEKELWDRVLAINLTAPYLASKEAVRAFMKQDPEGGVILNVSSTGGLFGHRAGAAYTTSKHGLIGLTKNIAASYSKRNIRCNAICPGGMMTNITDAFKAGVNETGQGLAFSTMAMQPGIADPEDVSKLCLYMCSDDSKVVNGAIVTADGGWAAF